MAIYQVAFASVQGPKRLVLWALNLDKIEIMHHALILADFAG
jgi:hypothetical protein